MPKRRLISPRKRQHECKLNYLSEPEGVIFKNKNTLLPIPRQIVTKFFDYFCN